MDWRRCLTGRDALFLSSGSPPIRSPMTKPLASAYQAMAAGTPGLLARAYFAVKPYIPRPVRMALRRGRARRIVKQCRDTWPINPEAGEPPQGWPGWPDSKGFAMVITHDVESASGVDKVRSLAELEISLGFRSSYNFIPEGPYEDPAELRDWLEVHGFEVGVHDLNHDGRLYGSREGFRDKARRINRYLDAWGAVGFRSGFMLRQLDWIHDLDVLYDASTFDTDPFEPQPDGSQTIFPFQVRKPGGGGAGYTELSYTLPQDSTLFLLLGEETPEIWKRKLDWIASRGGLALVNIHPDYVDFSGRRTSACYPSTLVRDFLDHLRTRHKGAFWNPLPRDLATWYRREVLPPGLQANPAC